MVGDLQQGVQEPALGPCPDAQRRHRRARPPDTAHHQGRAAPAWADFTGAVQIAQIRHTVTKARRKSVEVVYVITSADHRAAPPATLSAWVQGHWSIENRLHWVREVTFDEDRSQVRTGNAPHVMATLRNSAISLLRLDQHRRRLPARMGPWPTCAGIG